MRGYHWVHHLPTVAVNGRRYASIETWVRAEIEAQRRERRQLLRRLRERTRLL
ncbi:unnamed protein product, partial [Phaeothamnion confervicola]